jgi:hypothetical protein
VRRSPRPRRAGNVRWRLTLLSGHGLIWARFLAASLHRWRRRQRRLVSQFGRHGRGGPWKCRGARSRRARGHSRFPCRGVAVYTGILKTIGGGRTEEDVVETQPSVTLPPLPHVVPEGIHRLGRMQRSDCVHPALRENSIICRAALRLKPPKASRT